jgi:hypothetical protein
MPDRPLAVVTEIKEAIVGAQEARVGSVQRGVHLLRRRFFQDARLGDACIAVTTVLQVRDHETCHVRGAGPHETHRREIPWTVELWEYLKGVIFIQVPHGFVRGDVRMQCRNGRGVSHAQRVDDVFLDVLVVGLSRYACYDVSRQGCAVV